MKFKGGLIQLKDTKIYNQPTAFAPLSQRCFEIKEKTVDLKVGFFISITNNHTHEP